MQVFSVALSGPLLGAAYPAYVWLSLLPIVAGCAMSAMKEVRYSAPVVGAECGGQPAGRRPDLRRCPPRSCAGQLCLERL